jgi:hypothetical protein
MAINPNLCNHIWKYGFNYQKSGVYKPIQVIVLYCERCAKIKQQIVKEK